MVRMLWTHPSTGVEMIDPILGIIIKILFNFQSGNFSLTRADWHRRQTMLKRADTFLPSNLSEPFSLTALAAAAGATPRSVQREFSQAFGLPPGRWVQPLD